MFSRRFGRDTPDNGEYRDGGNVATAERERDTTALDRDGDGYRDGNGHGNGGAVAAPARRPGTARAAGDAVVLDREARLRQRDRFGGFNWGAAFFGWLVAIGMGVILTAIVSAAGAAIGLSNNPSKGDAGTIGIVGGALLIAIAVIAYYCGGDVAGRMSRFHRAPPGFGGWALGLFVKLLIAPGRAGLR